MSGLDYSIRAKLGSKSPSGKRFNEKQYLRNCKVKEALEKEFEGQYEIIKIKKEYFLPDQPKEDQQITMSKATMIFNQMTQEEKNNYYKGLEQ